MHKRIFPVLALLAMISGCATREAPERMDAAMFPAVTQSAGNFAATDRTSKSSGVTTAISSVWMTAISAGGPAVLDAATIQNPDTSITNSTTIELDCSNWFSKEVAFRLVWSGTPSANLTGTVWGRTSTSEAWTRLTNLNGDVTMTFTPNAALDPTDGTLYYTSVDPVLHVVDRMGCNYLQFGVQVPFNGTVTNTSMLQAKAVD